MSRNTKTAVVASTVTAVVMLLLFFGFLRFVPSLLHSPLEQKLAALETLVDRYAIYDFDTAAAETDAAYGYLCGLTDDPYFMYYTADEYAQMLAEVRGDGSGLGLELSYGQQLSDGVFIRRVCGGSPAEAAGIAAGDRIVSFDGQDLTAMTADDFDPYLEIKTGQTVRLGILRDGQPMTFDVTAQVFTDRAVDYEKTADNLGYVRIYHFDTNALASFRAAIEDLNAQDVRGYIFDVRGNGGGELETVCGMVDLFVSSGDLIVMQSREGEEVRTADAEDLVDVPCAVLVNRETASAAEMFSSALRDLVGAPLIGETTYGKAVGQTFFELGDGSAVKFTTFRYSTQSRADFNGVGLVPDITENYDDQQTLRLFCRNEADPQLALAIEQLGDKE